ncbi:peptidylprolyl isomerase [Wenzhouxiangella sp. AB-CW3]|uniref:peptidylprolyl isomerase n=1 Tax=Wenzhouxiangella sp. AB-CW3 TaxID=2771012 RepID=UPI00168B1C66|nr:peptidylprolyl isomerase [Wenzhouxiangella sp. AB-CW3]QOC23054.1 peptidylprolyl isomerase [Wenzhouxiangella sp. AB-CW3]
MHLIDRSVLMTVVSFPILISLLALASPLVANERYQAEFCLGFESDPLVRVGGIVTTELDFDAFMAGIPEADRTQFVASAERVANQLEALVMQRGVALNAKGDGLLDEDELLNARLMRRLESALNEIQIDRYIEARLLDDYTERARELYLTGPDRFREPRRYSFSHILIQTSNRGESGAMRLILDLYDRIESGESFEALVEEYSEDPASRENAGRYEAVTLDELDSNFARELRDLSEPGELSEPVRSRFGWHIIRLDEAHEREIPEWEEVADKAGQLARQRHRERLKERYLSSVLESDDLEVTPGVIERLQRRYGFDPETGLPARD